MVKIGRPITSCSEDRWNQLTNEQAKSLVCEINLEVSKIVAEMEVKLELLTVKFSTHEWYNLVSRLERKLKYLRECFPPYSVESCRSFEESQKSDILQEFKEFNKRKNYQEQYLNLKAEILNIERFLFENAPAKKKNEEIVQKLTQLRAQIDSNRSFLMEVKASIKSVTSEIIREKKAMQREVAHMKRQKANALQRLEELRATLQQKEVLLKETTEQRKIEHTALQREIQENKRLVQTLNDRMEEQKILQEKVCMLKHGWTNKTK
ncbi:hypothetical protein OS493_022815 [Desmophyllum pertusum]|uniref:Uncharacterized protein n=1 Tax=Desmophyllum pertusum TaxID=174260 RepID=A0A9X0D9N3_9CNID|nr:hypothetical protein OS493_022815 [Desmophyllum pertusum]